MLSLLSKCIEEEVIEPFNARKDVSLTLKKDTSVFADFSQTPSSQSHLYYNIFISGSEEEQIETRGFFDVTVKMELSIETANKEFSDFRRFFDKYIWDMQRNIINGINQYMNRGESSNIIIREIGTIRIANGDRIENQYYRPTIELGLKIIDTSIMNGTNLAFATQEVGT